MIGRAKHVRGGNQRERLRIAVPNNERAFTRGANFRISKKTLIAALSLAFQPDNKLRELAFVYPRQSSLLFIRGVMCPKL